MQMIYTGYLLNPGDMYQVDRDLVLLAVGAPKPTPQKQDLDKQAKEEEERQESSKPMPQAVKKEPEEISESVEDADAAETMVVDARETAAEEAVEEEPEDEARARQKEALKSLSSQIKIIMDAKIPLDAKRKQGYRAVNKELRSMLSRYQRLEASEVDSKITEWTTQLASFLPADLKVRKKIERTSAKQDKTPEAQDAKARNAKAKPTEEIPEEPLRALVSLEESTKALQQTIHQIQYNPKDLSKIYVTPWRPRPFMAPFAFIPRYLEVNHNICAAVYLRHPVARKGLSEVPSPFGPTEMQLAHSWYLRRR